MFDVAFSLAEALNVAWALVGDELRNRIKLELRDRRRRAAILRRVRLTVGALDKRSGATLFGLLDDPAFVDFVADSDDPALRARLDLAALTEVVGSEEAAATLASALAGCFACAALDEATATETLMLGQLSRLDETLLHVLNAGLDAHAEIARLDRRIGELAKRLSRDMTRSLDGAPFVAADVDLADRFRMRSDLTAGRVPAYVKRDVDPVLADRIQEVRIAGGLVAVAGSVKSGKTRTLLEALRLEASSVLVIPIRRARRRDTLAEALDALEFACPEQPWVMLVEDLLEHLFDGTSLGAAVERAGDLAQPGFVAATVVDDVFFYTDEDLRLAAITHDDVRLLAARSVRLATPATEVEQDRFRLVHDVDITQVGPSDDGHFAERFAAIPQLLARAEKVLGVDPTHASRRSLLLGACQLAIVNASRSLEREDLERAARRVYGRLVPRPTAELSNQQFEDAEQWACRAVGSAYALLDARDRLVLNDAVLARCRLAGADPKFVDLDWEPSDATQLGLVQYFDGTLDASRIWFQHAAGLSDPTGTFVLGR